MIAEGFKVSQPTLDSVSPYDYIIDDGELLHRVQVKTLRRRKNGKYELKLRATHRRAGPDHVYTPDDADWVCGVDYRAGIIVWVATEDIQGQTSIAVGRWDDE